MVDLTAEEVKELCEAAQRVDAVAFSYRTPFMEVYKVQEGDLNADVTRRDMHRTDQRRIADFIFKMFPEYKRLEFKD